MSTRAHIGFFEKEPTEAKRTKPEVLIYKHSDGYPDGTLPQLVDFCVSFGKKRGLGDTEYATAQCLAHLINYANNDMNEWSKQQYNKEWENDYLGYGASTKFHGDIEFYYVVTPETIKVYEVSYDYDAKDEKKRYAPILKLERTVSLKN